MTPLGKSLVFHLKYLAEMYLLHSDPADGGKEPLAGLVDAEHVRSMAHIVGAAADNEAADFVEACGRMIEDYFAGLEVARLSKKPKRQYATRNWDWWARFQVTLIPEGFFCCGVFMTAPPDIRVSLDKDACGLVIPYLWAKGGRKGTDSLWKVVGNWADSRAGEGLVKDSGTVALAAIPIKPQPPGSFDVDREPLIADVVKTFQRIGTEQMKAIASLTAGLKELDES